MGVRIDTADGCISLFVCCICTAVGGAGSDVIGALLVAIMLVRRAEMKLPAGVLPVTEVDDAESSSVGPTCECSTRNIELSASSSSCKRRACKCLGSSELSSSSVSSSLTDGVEAFDTCSTASCND